MKRCYSKECPRLLSEFKHEGQTYKRVNYTSRNSETEKLKERTGAHVLYKRHCLLESFLKDVSLGCVCVNVQSVVSIYGMLHKVATNIEQ